MSLSLDFSRTAHAHLFAAKAGLLHERPAALVAAADPNREGGLVAEVRSDAR